MVVRSIKVLQFNDVLYAIMLHQWPPITSPREVLSSFKLCFQADLCAHLSLHGEACDLARAWDGSTTLTRT